MAQSYSGLTNDADEDTEKQIVPYPAYGEAEFLEDVYMGEDEYDTLVINGMYFLFGEDIEKRVKGIVDLYEAIGSNRG